MISRLLLLGVILAVIAESGSAQGLSGACDGLERLKGGVATPTVLSMTHIRKGFGEYGSSRKQGTKKHTGVDLILRASPSSSDGYEIRAIAAGKVAHLRAGQGYGEIVAIDHGNGCYSLYAHLAGKPMTPIKPGGNLPTTPLPIKLGESVAAGQVIGYIRYLEADLDSSGNAETLPKPYNLQTHIELFEAAPGRSGDGKLGQTVKNGEIAYRDPTPLLKSLGYVIE